MRAFRVLGNLLARSPAVDQPAALPDIEPVPLPGPWSFGIALGMHAERDGEKERSRIGELLTTFKYAGHRALARPFGGAIAEAVSAHRPQVVIHIPSSRRSSFEPACELALAAARALRVRCLPHLIALTRTVAPQKDLASLSEKRENIGGAFRVRRPGLIEGMRALIVDDVYDSGATLEEAWRAVSEAGAAGVIIATVTKTRLYGAGG